MSEIINNTGITEGICVAIRMRPLNAREISTGQEKIFKCLPLYNAISQNAIASTVHLKEGLKDGQREKEKEFIEQSQTYYYDKVFDEVATTANVYQHIGKDIVKGVAEGINGTIFAYGQTSSGKTHTMLGSGDQPGVLEMAAADIFNQISDKTNRDFLLRVSFVEIYNEIIRDLLSDATDSTVAIREDPRKGVYCEATELIISDYESIIKALKKGISKRAVEATAMNDTSSRSHTIFKIVIESKESTRVGYEADGAVLVASLNLVDLAGSESVRHTGATGQRAKEGGKINQSLLSLSRVIHALSTPGAHVSFRDSKLTRLLQPSLCGNAKMSVVCCITPSEKYLEETRSTLQFASRAKLVKTNATVNEVLDEGVQLKRLKKELEELKDKQRTTGLSVEEATRISIMEAEKLDLSNRLSSLQEEKDKQRIQLDKLREMIIGGVIGSDIVMDDSVISRKKDRKKFRDTWCPGKGGAPLPSSFLGSVDNNTVSNSNNDESFSSNNSSITKDDMDRSVNEISNEITHALEIDLLNKLINTRDETISELQSLNDNITEQMEMEIGASSEREKELLSNIFKLKNELLESNKKIESLKSSESDSDNDITIEMDVESNILNSELTMKLHAKEEEISQANNEIISLKNELSFFKSNKDLNISANSFTDNSSEIIAKLEQKVTELKNKLWSEESVSAASTEIISSLRIQLSELQDSNEMIEILETDLSESNLKIKILDTKLIQINHEYNKLKEDLSQSHAEIEELKLQEDESMNASQDIINELESKIVKLEEELNQNKEVVLSMENMSSTANENVINLVNRVKELENEIIQLQTTTTQYAESTNASQQIIFDLETKGLESTNSIEVLNNRIQELVNEMNQLQSNESESNAKQEIVTALELKISQFATLNSQLEEELNQNNEIISYMEQMSSEATCSISTLNNRVSELQDEIIQLQTTTTQYAESTNASQQIIFDLETKGLESTNSIEVLNNRIQELVNEMNQLQSNESESNAKQEIVTALELKISQLEEELSQSNEVIVHIEHESSVASESVIALTSRIEELQDEIIQLQAAATQDEICSKQSQDIINNLEAKIEVIKNQFEVEIISFKEDYKLLQEALDESTSKNNNMEAEVKNAEKVLYEAEVESKVLRTDLEDAMVREEELIKSLQTADNESILLREQIVYLESQLEGAISDSHEYQAVSKECEIKFINLLEENTKMIKLDSYANDLKCENIKLQNSFDEVTRLLSVEESKCVELLGLKEYAENKYQVVELELNEIRSLSSTAANNTMITQESIDFSRREMERTVESMRSELGLKEAEVSRLMIELNTIQNRVVIAEQAVSQNIAHSINASDNDEIKQKKLNQLQTQNDLLRGEKETSLLQINDLEKELKRIINSSRNSQDQLNFQIDQLISQNEKLKERNSDSSQFVDSIKALELKLFNTNKEFNEIELVANNAGNRVNELENEVYDLKEILNQGGNSNKIDQLNSKLEMVQVEKDQILLKKNELERDLKEMTNRLKKSKDENNLMKEEWSSSIDQTEETIKLLESEKLEVEEKLNESLIEISNLRNNKSLYNNDEIISNIEELKLKLSDSIDNFNKVKEDRDDLDYKLTMMNKDLINRDESINQLHTEINNITSNNLSNNGDKDDELISEMNVLMESNLELESRLSTAETQVKALNEQLANYDKSSAEEQDFIMRTAETQMDLLSKKLEESTSEVIRLNEIVTNLQMNEVTKLQEKILILENEVLDKENSIDNIKKEYASSKLLDKIHFTNNDNTIEKLNEQLEISLEKNKQLKLSIVNNSKITNESNALNNIIIELKNEINVKDKRITHLEAAKLTKDQVEKIKTLKEERKKFQEDSKTMKHQLHALKKTYDELKKSASSNGSTNSTIDSTTSRELLDLRVQIAEVSGQLDSSNHITQALKEKLRECSKQLQEYENERSAVVDVLMVYGIDVQGLLLHDTSISDDQSIIEQDLADAVEKLASNLNNIKNSTQENLTESISKIRILEENKEILTAELEDLKMQHTVVERRLETIKTNNRDHREEIADSKSEIESLKLRIEELESSLLAAEGAVSESSDNVSSEVQALEEENIELMKENKELRKECSTYKILSERLQGQVNKLNTSIPLSTKSKIPMSSSSPIQKENIENEKRKRIEKINSENDENSPPKRIISENIVPLASINENNTENEVKVKRTRAKPLVQATTDKEGAQECAQS